MSTELSMENRVVFITGGGRGIGRGITARFVEQGAKVFICGRNEPEDMPEGVSFLACDVRDADAVGEVVKKVAADAGRLDVVINNAGGAPFAEAATASPPPAQHASPAPSAATAAPRNYCADHGNLARSLESSPPQIRHTT